MKKLMQVGVSGEVRVLAKYFTESEQILDSQYALNSSDNSSDKGENREEFLLNFLNNNLPKVAVACRGGMIIDQWDRKSSQTDIVVYSSFAPLLRNNKKPLFLAEGAFAAIEVKSLLTSSILSSVLNWSSRLKCLEKNENNTLRIARTSESICTGVFAYASNIDDPTKIIEMLREHRVATAAPNTRMIDFICVNKKFCIVRHRTEDVTSSLRNGKDITKATKKKAVYHVYTNAVGFMMSRIVDSVSYVGSTDLMHYLCAQMREL
jgi:hypothetical protein